MSKNREPKMAFIDKIQRREKKTVKSERIDLRPSRVPLKNIAYLPPLEQKTFPLEPKVKQRNRPKGNKEFHVWLRLFLSRNPHLEFLKIHQSSLSANCKQWLFKDTKRNVTIAKTDKQVYESIRERTDPGGFVSPKSLDEILS